MHILTFFDKNNSCKRVTSLSRPSKQVFDCILKKKTEACTTKGEGGSAKRDGMRRGERGVKNGYKNVTYFIYDPKEATESPNPPPVPQGCSDVPQNSRLRSHMYRGCLQGFDVNERFILKLSVTEAKGTDRTTHVTWKHVLWTFWGVFKQNTALPKTRSMHHCNTYIDLDVKCTFVRKCRVSQTETGFPGACDITR